jgi:hypothetical protein
MVLNKTLLQLVQENKAFAGQMPGRGVLGDFHYNIYSSLRMKRWNFLFSHFWYSFRANGNKLLVIKNVWEGNIRFLSHSIPLTIHLATYAALCVGQGMGLFPALWKKLVLVAMG